MAEKTYQMTAPTGTRVEVKGELRHQALLLRGYVDGWKAQPKAKK